MRAPTHPILVLLLARVYSRAPAGALLVFLAIASQQANAAPAWSQHTQPCLSLALWRGVCVMAHLRPMPPRAVHTRLPRRCSPGQLISILWPKPKL